MVDHPFSDGSKRTVAFLTFAFANENKKQVDRKILIHQIILIAKNNITEIRNIEWRIKSAVN